MAGSDVMTAKQLSGILEEVVKNGSCSV